MGIKEIRAAWSKATCYPPLADKWSPDNPALGQCAVTVLLIQDLFGGRIFCDKSKHHYYNSINGSVIDLTADQFDNPVRHDYTNETTRKYLLRSENAIRANTLNRYTLLKAHIIKRIIIMNDFIVIDRQTIYDRLRELEEMKKHSMTLRDAQLIRANMREIEKLTGMSLNKQS